MMSSRDRYRIVVADDDFQVASFLREALRREGHVVSLCRNGGEVLKALSNGPHDALVLDLRMPRILELRANCGDLGVILLSSSLPEETRSAFEGIERVAFLQKPFGLAELREALGKVVGSVKI